MAFSATTLLVSLVTAVGIFAAGVYAGKEFASAKCLRDLNAINAEISVANSKIRFVEKTRRDNYDRLLEERRLAAETKTQQDEATQKRIDNYEAELASNNRICTLTERDIKWMSGGKVSLN